MHKRTHVISLLIAAVPAAGGTALSASHPKANPVASLASQVMTKLIAGDPVGAIARIHEPSTWDAAKASADRNGAAEGLGMLLREFGKISAPSLAGDVAFYELQVAGADEPYWQSLQNRGIDSRLIYRVNFSNVG